MTTFIIFMLVLFAWTAFSIWGFYDLFRTDCERQEEQAPTPAFIVNCGYCDKELKLLKDSTDGMRCFCGECYSKFKKEAHG